MGVAREFLELLSKDPSSLRRIQLTRDMVELLIKADQQDRGFAVAKIEDVPKLSAFAVSGIVDGTVRRPTRIKKIGNEFWISSVYQKIAKFDENWSFLGWVGKWGEPFSSGNPTDRYAYVHSFDVDLSNDRIAICMQWRQCVSVFRLSTFEHLYTIGDGNAGHVADGRLWSPTDVLWVDGNLIVVSFNGYGDGGTNHGHVSVYDGENGQFIKTLLADKGNRYPWFLECHNPVRAFITPDRKLFISYYSDHLVAEFSLADDLSISYETSYFKPNGIDAGAIYPRGIYVTDTLLYITLQGPKKIAILDRSTHDLVGVYGFARWEDRKSDVYSLGAVWDVWDVFPYSEDVLIVADYGNNRVGHVPTYWELEASFTLDRQIPEEAKVLASLIPYRVDIENGKVFIPIDRASKLPEQFIIPYEVK